MGGDQQGQGNVISGNDEDGVFITGEDATGTRVEGNKIGLDANGTAKVGNKNNGVEILGSNRHFIGAVGQYSRNVISGNGGSGISFHQSNRNEVKNNYIGTYADGTGPAPGAALVGNEGSGVTINLSSDNLIGGTGLPNGGDPQNPIYGAGAGNVISSNGKPNGPNPGNGVEVFGFSSERNRIYGNFIGTDVNEANPNLMGNTLDGAYFWNVGEGNEVGGFTNAEGNTILNNVNGIHTVRTAGVGPIPIEGKNNDIQKNKEAGIRIEGGTFLAEYNTIADNEGPGIIVVSGTGHSFTHNSIHDNAGAGIRVLAGTNNLAFLNTITSNSGGGIHLPDNSTASTFQISQNTLDSLLVEDGSAEVVGLSPVTSVALSGGGNITGASVLEVLGSMTWTGGSQTGSGRTDIASAATLAMSTSQTLALRRLVRNSGAASWAGPGRLALDAGAAFLNQPSATFTASGTGTLGSDDGTGAFTNLGAYTQAGVMSLPSFAGPLAFANSGAVQVGVGALLSLLGTYQQTAGSTSAQGSGDLAVQGSFTQTGGSVSVMGFGSVLSVTGPYQQTSGTSTYGGTGGRLSVNGSVTVSASAVLTLSNGLLDATGLIAIQSGATLNRFGGGITGQVANAGTLSLVGGVAGLYSLSITGTYTQTGTLKMGIASGSYSQLTISGLATLGGLLDIDFVGGSAAPGHYFQLLNYGSVSGAFGSFDLPPLSFGVWRHNYYPTNFVLWVSYF